MPVVSFKKPFTPITTESGENLMRLLLAHGRPVARSCDGDSVCGKCLVQVLEGSENLSSPTKGEIQRKQIMNWPDDQRLSCQCQVLGDISIDTAYW